MLTTMMMMLDPFLVCVGVFFRLMKLVPSTTRPSKILCQYKMVQALWVQASLGECRASVVVVLARQVVHRTRRVDDFSFRLSIPKE